MEDLYDPNRGIWQRDFWYPRYLRFLWVAALLTIGGVIVWWFRGLREMRHDQPARAWAAIAIIALLALYAFWASVRAWLTHVICSPNSIKLAFLFHGRQRISWDNMARVFCKWRFFGHTITLVGSDGARVKFRSSIAHYDRLIALIRRNAPDHIRDELDDLLGEEEEETPAAEGRGPEPQAPAAPPQQQPAPPARPSGPPEEGEYHDG